MLVLALLGCVDDTTVWDSTDSGPGGESWDSGGCCGHDCALRVDVEDDALAITLCASDYPLWLFAMAQAGAGAAGWYGESCIEGPEPHGMDDQGFDYCHDRLVPGEPLVLALADPYTPENVVENETTLFTKAMLEQTTFVIATVDETGPCYVWGNDNSYYSAYGCTAM